MDSDNQHRVNSLHTVFVGTQSNQKQRQSLRHSMHLGPPLLTVLEFELTPFLSLQQGRLAGPRRVLQPLLPPVRGPTPERRPRVRPARKELANEKEMKKD